MTNVYTIEEVARHDTENDLWIAMNGHVYDLSKFLKQHPGGEDVLLHSAGQDGTVCFDDVGHTTDAIQLREIYKIGELSSAGDKAIASSYVSNLENKKRAAAANDDDDDADWKNYEEVKPTANKALPVVVAVGVLLYAIIFYHYLF